MKTEHLHQGASFVKVLCGLSEDLTNKGCHDKGGAKWLFHKHKGYKSTGGQDITASELSEAEMLACDHETQNPNHNVRVVVGHL